MRASLLTIAALLQMANLTSAASKRAVFGRPVEEDSLHRKRAPRAHRIKKHNVEQRHRRATHEKKGDAHVHGAHNGKTDREYVRRSLTTGVERAVSETSTGPTYIPTYDPTYVPTKENASVVDAVATPTYSPTITPGPTTEYPTFSPTRDVSEEGSQLDESDMLSMSMDMAQAETSETNAVIPTHTPTTAIPTYTPTTAIPTYTPTITPYPTTAWPSYTPTRDILEEAKVEMNFLLEFGEITSSMSMNTESGSPTYFPTVTPRPTTAWPSYSPTPGAELTSRQKMKIEKQKKNAN